MSVDNRCGKKIFPDLVMLFIIILFNFTKVIILISYYVSFFFVDIHDSFVESKNVLSHINIYIHKSINSLLHTL